MRIIFKLSFILSVAFIASSSLCKADSNQSLNQQFSSAFESVANERVANISEDELRNILLKDYNLNDSEVEGIVTSLKSVNPQKKLAISGVLYTSGFNVALFTDTNLWNFDVTFKSPDSHTMVRLPNFIQGNLENGGLVIEASYKFIIGILLNNMSVDRLDGAVFGRGLGGILDVGIGLEASFLPGVNRPANMLIVAPIIGLGGGIRIPRVTFSKSQL